MVSVRSGLHERLASQTSECTARIISRPTSFEVSGERIGPLTRFGCMLLRRVVALFSSVTMLHLSVGSADAACTGTGAAISHSTAAHGTRARQSTHAHHGTMDHARMAVTATSSSLRAPVAPVAGVAESPSPRTPDGSPAPSRCCESMTSCSVTGTVTPRVSIASSLRGASLMLGAVTEAPSSVAPAPEPPPPKA